MATATISKIGNFVWEDKNGNGIQDAGEVGVSGVTVKLYGQDNEENWSLWETKTTNAQGLYSLANFSDGDKLRLQFSSLPAGYVFTSNTGDVTQANNSDVSDTTNGYTNSWVINNSSSAVTLVSGEPDEIQHNYVDAGIYKYASLSNRAWNDVDSDGIQDSGEVGLAGVTVNLYRDGSTVAAKTTTTDANGLYAFSNIVPGNYKIQFVKEHYTYSPKDATTDDTKDSDVNSTGYTDSFLITSGQTISTISAGMYRTASLGNKLWIDTDGDGFQDANEKGLGDVKVTLTQGSQTWTTKTSSAAATLGEYRFDELPAGQFKVKFDLPSGYIFTLQKYVADTSKDSDVNTNGEATINLVSSQENMDVDAGVYSGPREAMLGNYVWRDNNADGIQDNSANSKEKGIPNVVVKLFNSSDSFVQQTQTNANGIYDFYELVPGKYYVKFEAPAGLRFSPKDATTNDELDSDAKIDGVTDVYTLTAGQENYSVDAGLNDFGSIGDTVWLDKVYNGIQDGVAAGENGFAQVKVDLYQYDSVNKAWNYNYGTTTTNASGAYKFDNLPAALYAVKVNAPDGYAITLANQGSDRDKDSDVDSTTGVAYYNLKAGENVTSLDAGLVQLGSIGDTVWNDKDGDGKQDGAASGEGGLSGVSVKLSKYDATTGTWITNYKTTQTDGNGQYLFDKLPAGRYSVKFTPLPGYTLSKANAIADDTRDSDPSPSTGAVTYDLATGENVRTIDAGMYRAASVGDRLWYDHSSAGEQDGQQSAGENGLSGATIHLYSSSGAHYTTTTGNDGYFKFNVPAGTYRMYTGNQNMYYAPYHQGPSATDSDLRWSISAWGLNGTKPALATGVKYLGNYSSAGAPFDSGSGYTDWFNLSAGQNDTTKDLGLTPLVIDLGKDGIHTTARTASDAVFDLLGNGHAIKSGWISGGDAFLAIDNNHNGVIDHIHELFGGVKQGDGFAKLVSFDSNADGVVDAADAQFAALKIWQDANGNHETDAGELISLSEANIASLAVDYTVIPMLDAQGNLQLERSSATFTDGSTTAMNDVYFNISQVDAEQAGVVLPSLADLVSDNQSVEALVGDANQGPVAVAMSDVAGLDVLKKLAGLYEQAAHLTN